MMQTPTSTYLVLSPHEMTSNNKSKQLCWTESLCIYLCWYFNTMEFQPSKFVIKFPKAAIGQNSYLTWAFSWSSSV